MIDTRERSSGYKRTWIWMNLVSSNYLMGKDKNSSQGADFVLRKLFEPENESMIRMLWMFLPLNHNTTV